MMPYPSAAALRPAAVASLSALLGACMSMSGLDGRTDYACQAPPGVQCNSVSGNYANAIRNNLPSQRLSTAAAARLDSASTADPAPHAAPPPVLVARSAMPDKEASASRAELATPLRSPPQILRLWVKAREDADHDLVDQGYVYLQVDPGRWRLDHVHQRVRDAYAAIRPPHPTASAAPASPSSTVGPTPAPAAPQPLSPPSRDSSNNRTHQGD